jgi:hypothetical protein
VIIIPLYLIAEIFSEELQLPLIFDSFRQNAETERLSETKNDLDDAFVLDVFVGYPVNKLHVYLYPVYRQRFEAAKGGILCAEVVDRNSNAEGLKPVKGCNNKIDIVGSGTFSHFELKVLGIQTGFLQGAGDNVEELGIPELA